MSDAQIKVFALRLPRQISLSPASMHKTVSTPQLVSSRSRIENE